MKVKSINPLRELKNLGQSIWLDSIQRGQILSGGLKRLINEDGLRGETANPTIFEKAMLGSGDYDESIRKLAVRYSNPYEIYEALAIEDVRMAADVFRPVYELTEGTDGFVSIEVSPRLARDTQGTIAEVKRFWSELNRPNVMIKIPGTPEGETAVEECLYEGINVNITLLFSVEAYKNMAWAYIRALTRRAEEGKSIDRIASVASFFVSRIDTLADKMIGEKLLAESNPGLKRKLESLRGSIAIANAKMAYQSFKSIFGERSFSELRSKGAHAQRPLWASTSTKNPLYRDVLYVEELIGPDTVNTLPLETIEAFRDHGRVRLTIESGLDKAGRDLETLAEAGISLDSITHQVLDEGVNKFNESLEKLLDNLDAKRRAVSRRAG